ncbi:MAG: hypothetical protein ACOYOB_09635 [Myxococcota bacterium]|jgi:rubrerythrin
MATSFNYMEVLEIAKEIEREGARFYREASARATHETARRLLHTLAVEEHGHEAYFEDLQQKALTSQQESSVPDLDEVTGAYLRSLAPGRIFPQARDATDWLSGQESPADVLRVALRMEEAAVAFYAALKRAMPPEWDPDHLQELLSEEERHVALIRAALRTLGA